MIRVALKRLAIRTGWPRTSGDDPSGGSYDTIFGDVGPARPGMIRTPRTGRTVSSRWPRTSGDDPQFGGVVLLELELAPHERG